MRKRVRTINGSVAVGEVQLKRITRKTANSSQDKNDHSSKVGFRGGQDGETFNDVTKNLSVDSIQCDLCGHWFRQSLRIGSFSKVKENKFFCKLCSKNKPRSITGDLLPDIDRETKTLPLTTRSKMKSGSWEQACLKLIEDLWQDDDSEPFRQPVDLTVYTDYLDFVKTPMDLSTINEKLILGIYHTIQDFIEDIETMFANARKYNTDKKSPVYLNAFKLRRLFREKESQLYVKAICSDNSPNHFYLSPDTHKTKNGSFSDSDNCEFMIEFEGKEKETELFAEGTPITRTRSSFRSINESWEPACIQLIDELCRNENSEPFRKPVDLTVYPDYLDFVKTPIDLSTIKRKLIHRNYETIQEFVKDVETMFANSHKYNSDKKSPAFKMGFRLRKLFREKETQLYSKDISLTRTRSCFRSKYESWERNCSKLVDYLWENDDSMPFRQPVDLKVYPDYLDFVETPMDLSTIKQKITGRAYQTIQDFIEDMETMFANSRRYHRDKKSPVFIMGFRLRKLFREKETLLYSNAIRRARLF